MHTMALIFHKSNPTIKNEANSKESSEKKAKDVLEKRKRDLKEKALKGKGPKQFDFVETGFYDDKLERQLRKNVIF